MAAKAKAQDLEKRAVWNGAPWVSRQTQKPHGKTKNLTAKPKTSRQNQKSHGKTKNPTRPNQNLTAKPKTPRGKPKTSRQNQTVLRGKWNISIGSPTKSVKNWAILW